MACDACTGAVCFCFDDPPDYIACERCGDVGCEECAGDFVLVYADFPCAAIGSMGGYQFKPPARCASCNGSLPDYSKGHVLSGEPTCSIVCSEKGAVKCPASGEHSAMCICRGKRFVGDVNG